MMDNQQRQAQLIGLLDGMMRSQAISMAVKLDLADRLADGMKSISHLAQETCMHEASLHRLLRALASIGIFAEKEPYTFTNTEASSLLRSDHPASLRDTARLLGSDVFCKSWGFLDYSIKTGKHPFGHVFRKNMWPYLLSHPDEQEHFQQAMTSITQYENVSLPQVYDFSSKAIADIGGGHGGLLTSILTHCPHAHGILFDTAAVIEQAQEYLSPELRERIMSVPGNFFEQVPMGADVYVLKNILHDWPDQECLTILQNCRRAIKPDGKVLVIERVTPETIDYTRIDTFFVDLMMVALFGGRERSDRQMQHLYAQSGLRQTRVIATGVAGLHMVECIAVDFSPREHDWQAVLGTPLWL
jgi:ubiquinone/menaquinone biosynthesis C-methylase UbiE